MKEVLFKSEKLTIVADSENRVVYGTTTKKEAIKYLSSLTSESSEETVGIIMLIVLIIENKYIAAKKISISTVVTVQTAKSSMVKTAEDALRIASKFNLEAEVQKELDNGATPLEALEEWDII